MKEAAMRKPYFLFYLALALALFARSAHAQQEILTHHYDRARTGWNQNETILNVTNVGGTGFGLLKSVTLDEQVDAQPLFVPNVTIPNQGAHDVVYVATENNTVYAIDATSGPTLGQVLISKHFGTPVPISALPGMCSDNAGVVGIASTPVIDQTTNTMYLIVYSYENNTPIYRIHAIDITTLQDKAFSPVIVAGSHTLADGRTIYKFNAAVSRQRPALLEANGVIYAGFGSFCDVKTNLSRGWILGWTAAALLPLKGNQLDDQLVTSQHNFFLSSVWMSGAGMATDTQGYLYFATGNSDPSGTSYNSATNLSESVVKLHPTLTKVLSFFTPSNESQLDVADVDFGSGGVLVVPDQTGRPPLAVAAGKIGSLFVMNRLSLGGFNPVNKVLGTYFIGRCWCAESYFQGSDGVGRIVTSGADDLEVWQIQTSGTLIKEGFYALPKTSEEAGFFTSVSSNRMQAGTQIIWAIGRPVNTSPANITLYAFNATPVRGTFTKIFSEVAGTWPNGGFANLVPVVANGHVFVASNRLLAIFGLILPAHGVAAGAAPIQATEPERAPLSPGEHEIFGTIESINSGSNLTVATRSGNIQVDASPAVQAYQSVTLTVEEAVRLIGTYGSSGILKATSITRAKSNPAGWLPDR
jgi:outer membrane protein assembly factor BamB